jgi:Family of unknown function (DUF6580)
MNSVLTQKEVLFFRMQLALLMIVIAAALRVAPHPWNFTPIGAMALFSGAIIRDRRIAFLFPLLALFAGDVFIGFHKLMLIVYGSFLLSVLIGRLLQQRRSVPRLAGATFLGSLQFFLITNFAMWWLYNFFPKTAAGLVACYLNGLPLFWNTLAGDAVYVAFLFFGYALAEKLFPALRESAPVISMVPADGKKR